MDFLTFSNQTTVWNIDILLTYMGSLNFVIVYLQTTIVELLQLQGYSLR